MEYVGEPNRVTMPYDMEAERALVRVHLFHYGVPWRVLEIEMPLSATA